MQGMARSKSLNTTEQKYVKLISSNKTILLFSYFRLTTKEILGISLTCFKAARMDGVGPTPARQLAPSDSWHIGYHVGI